MVMRVVENAHFFETTNHQLQKDGFVGNWKLVLYWTLRPNTIKESWRIEVSIYSLSRVGSHSWVRILNCLNKFARDLTEKARTPGTNDENDSDGTGTLVEQETRIVKHSRTEADKHVAKAKPKPTSAPPSAQSQKSIPIQERNWIDVEPREHAQKGAQSFTISTKMIALLRHGTLLRDQDAAMEFRRFKEEFKSVFPTSTHWSIRLRIDHLKTGAGHKKRFQFCTNSAGTQILYLRAIHGHSGENPVDPSLSDNVLIPTTSLSSSITSGVASNCTLSLHQDWLREAKLMGELVKQCSSQLLTLRTKVGLSKKNTTWHSPVTLLTNKIGNLFRMRCIGTKFVVLKTWSCNSFRQDRMRSYSITHFQQPVLKGCPEQQRKGYIRERSRLVLHRLLCSSLIGAMTWSKVLQKERGDPFYRSHLTAAMSSRASQAD